MKTFLINAVIPLMLLLAACSKSVEAPAKHPLSEKPSAYFESLDWTLTKALWENDKNMYTWTLKGVPKAGTIGLSSVEELRIYKMAPEDFFGYKTGLSVPGAVVWAMFNKYL